MGEGFVTSAAALVSATLQCWTTAAMAQQEGKQLNGIHQGIKGKALQAWKKAENWGRRADDIIRTERKSKANPTNRRENNSSDGVAPWKLGLGNNPHVVESRGEVITGSCGCRDLAFGPGANKAQGCWLWGLAEQQREEKLLGMLWLACLWLTGFDARVVDLGVKATDH